MFDWLKITKPRTKIEIGDSVYFKTNNPRISFDYGHLSEGKVIGETERWFAIKTGNLVVERLKSECYKKIVI